MKRYFGQVNFTIQTENEEEAEQVQQDVRLHIISHYGAIVDASADEMVEFDEYQHAGPPDDEDGDPRL